MTEIHRMKANTLSEAKREALRNFGKTDGSKRVCVVELDSQGNPVSASYTRLPGDQAWVTLDMQEEPNIEDLLVDACAGILPPDFDRWELAAPAGYTVAHVAAHYANLPCSFDRWELATPTGWTVAHEAAATQNLPPDFDRWELADMDGYTVRDAHKNCRKVLEAYNEAGE